jgi:fucose 4-O-acetylase-like acetyltransferase
VDLLRAGSLLVVVLWHWVFTVLVWKPDGPHASNPIGHTSGLWLLTWFLQVMPVFFFVGGYVHHRTWRRGRRAGRNDLDFLRKRMARLVVPTLALLALVGAARVGAEVLAPEAEWVGRSLFLMVSPLWFLGVYLLLVSITPLAARAHERLGELALVGFGAGVVLVELLRFRFDVPYVEWANFLFVYGFAHQLGFWWDELAAAPRRRVAALALAGLTGLVVLTNIGVYPRSMVGVPGEPISNMAPPSACILALCLFQVGLVMLARPRVTAWLAAGGAARPVRWANTNSMTVFLWHFTGYAAFVGILTLVGIGLVEQPDAGWWAQRPLWLIGPAICTVPLVRTFRRLEAA